MSQNQQNQDTHAGGSSGSVVVKRRVLSACCLGLMALAVSACGEAPSGSDVADSTFTATDESVKSRNNVIAFSFGEQQLEFPANTCRITAVIVIVQGQVGDTIVDLLYDGRPSVNYQHYFERDGVRHRNQWDDKRDGLEYSVDGNTVTASGTMGITNSWREGSDGGWVDATGSDAVGDRPFTFSATCN